MIKIMSKKKTMRRSAGAVTQAQKATEKNES